MLNSGLENEADIDSGGNSIAALANCSISACSASSTTATNSFGVIGGGFGALLGRQSTVSVIGSNVSSCSVFGSSAVGGGVGLIILQRFSSVIEIERTTFSFCSLNGDGGIAGGQAFSAQTLTRPVS